MPKIKLERYVRTKKAKGGKVSYYLQLPSWAKGKKIDGIACPLQMSTKLGNDLGLADQAAKKYLKMWDAWRAGKDVNTVLNGTVAWLFKQYEKHKSYKDLSPRTRKDYDAQLQRLKDFKLKTRTFGNLPADSIKAKNADALYEKLIQKHGQRQASYAMQVARRVWNVTSRLGHVSNNPFESMGIILKPQNETRPWSREEIDLFKTTAKDMGYQMWATAITIAFELLQRPGDVIGRKDEAGRIVDAFLWTDYRAGEHIHITQNKTGKKLLIPMRDQGGQLFPELEAELATTPKVGPYIVMDTHHNSGIPSPMTERKFAHVFGRIRKAAGLSTDLKFMGCRHGGATELGDAGVEDVRPMTGHEGMAITKTYNKASTEKARRAARKRNLLKEEVADIKASALKA